MPSSHTVGEFRRTRKEYYLDKSKSDTIDDNTAPLSPKVTATKEIVSSPCRGW